MAQKVDIGVVRDTAADIIAVPTITDNGVPSNYSFKQYDNMPQGPVHKRDNSDPDSRTISDKGIGVPYNPANGEIRD